MIPGIEPFRRRVHRVDTNEPLTAGQVEGSEQGGVDQGENGRRGSYPERQDQADGRKMSGARVEARSGVAEVLEDRTHAHTYSVKETVSLQF